MKTSGPPGEPRRVRSTPLTSPGALGIAKHGQASSLLRANTRLATKGIVHFGSCLTLEILGPELQSVRRLVWLVDVFRVKVDVWKASQTFETEDTHTYIFRIVPVVVIHELDIQSQIDPSRRPERIL